MAPRPRFTTEELIAVCERFYERDGFVKWADVGKALGVSRQAVTLRFNAAIERGEVDAATVDRFRSIGSRSQILRRRREERHRQRNHQTLSLTFTPENVAWIRQEAAFRGVAITEFMNGLITRLREQPAPPPSMEEK